MRNVLLASALIVLIVAAGCRPAAAPARLGDGGSRGDQVLTFSMMRMGQKAGGGEIRIAADGTRREHFTYNDRGRGPDLRTEMVVDASGAPRRYCATGHDYRHAPVDERLDDTGGLLTWQSIGEHGQARAGWYLPRDSGEDWHVVLVRALLRAPGHRVALLPTGEAWLEDDTVREIEIAGARRRLRRVAIGGLDFEPRLVWLDENGELFADVYSWYSLIRTGAEPAIPALLADDSAWRAARDARLAATLAHRPPGGVLAIRHARLFDSEHRSVTPDATVVIEGDRIAAVGGAATVIPPGAQVIDAHGRTLLPGLWDMHVHEASSSHGILQLASGITQVRDLGNNLEDLAARVARFDAGTAIGPRVLRAGLIDGPGPFIAPIGVIANDADEATRAVARYAETGHVQIKVYSSLSPSLVPVIAEATHARGLRLSGHVPNGMNAAEAVEAGFDELQHANFLFLRFLAHPGDDLRTPVRFTRVAQDAAGLDLGSPAVQQLLDLLAMRHTVLDPTLIAFHAMFTSDPGELAPALVPYARRLPPARLRIGRRGGLPASADTRARYRASFAAMQRMIKLAWDHKIPIVAGTDDIAGLTLPHELALYVEAGIPAADVLSLATLGAARVMGKEREAGSIAVGKRADLVLVDGDPTRDIAAIRNTDVVVCRGVVYAPAELFHAAGIAPR